jgi:pimeloyl-ACP methyl ester carboxylesterase
MVSSPSTQPQLQPQSQFWDWQGFPICYQCQGNTGLPLLLIHGFGASSDHWRHLMPLLAQNHRVYALDLLGFGRSPKPTPGNPLPYTFETWSRQVVDFCQQVIGDPTVLIGNSIGCVVALQAAVDAPARCPGVVLVNCSLRLLHDRKRRTLPWYRRMSAPILQRILTNRAIGHYFFSRLARPQVIRKILLQAYARPEAVTEDLVDLLYQPALDPGAADVFLAFTGYSQGPLPEDLLPQLACPALILWGTDDPWEPITLGRELAKFPTVEGFIPLDGVGHCPQDESPALVFAALEPWLQNLNWDEERN